VARERDFGEKSSFAVLRDRFFQQYSCSAAAYAAFPHLVDIGAAIPSTDAADLWFWLGAIAACHDVAFDHPPSDLLPAFYAARGAAEPHAIDALLRTKRDAVSTYELIEAAIGLTGNPLGKLVMDHMGPYDDAGTNVQCPRCDEAVTVAVFDTGWIVEEPDQDYPNPPSERPLHAPAEAALDQRDPNPWGPFASKLRELAGGVPPESALSPHLRLAANVMDRGISERTPPGAVFSVIGSLLMLKGHGQHAPRYFRAWGRGACPTCKTSFVFADQWWGLPRKPADRHAGLRNSCAARADVVVGETRVPEITVSRARK
jgi:hypothetical protein